MRRSVPHAAVRGMRQIKSGRAKGKGICWPVLLFLIALVVPWVIAIGPLRLSLYRIVLLVMVLPCLVMWTTRKAGRIRGADIALLLFWFWSALSNIVIHGLESSIQTVGIGFVETIGAYLLARCYIRDADGFHDAIQMLFGIVLVLMPFAVLELVTGHNLPRELFAAIMPTNFYPPEQRSGLTRVLSVFDHPVLFGLCSGSILALVHLALGYQESFVRRSFRTLIVGGTALLSLSAGPTGAVLIQGFLLSWNGLLGGIRNRWTILTVLLVCLVLLIEIVANRSALNIIVSFVLFETASYWYRTLIWTYGSETVLNHPWFGVGLNDWERPGWMPTASIDSFWLYLAIRAGLPAVLLMLLAFLWVYLAVSLKKGLEGRLAEYRTGYLISMTSFFMVGWTGHFWDTAYVLLLFMMGSGVWMLDVANNDRVVLRTKGIQVARWEPSVHSTGSYRPGSRRALGAATQAPPDSRLTASIISRNDVEE
jgi:O-antigen ligase